MMDGAAVQAKMREAERCARAGNMPAVELIFGEIKTDARARARTPKEHETAEAFCDVMDATLLVLQVSYVHGGKHVREEHLVPMVDALERMEKATAPCNKPQGDE